MSKLTQEQKDARKESLKSFLSPEAIQGYAQAGIGIGTSIADTVQNQKLKKAQNDAALKDLKAGGLGVNDYSSNNQQTPQSAPTGDSDKILGMSKPIFFGGIGVLVLVAGVGIYLATKGSSAPVAAAK